MLILKLVSIIDGVYTYSYFPEGREANRGEVVYSQSNNEVDITILHLEDQFYRYATHAYKRVKEYSVSNTFLDEDLVAWY